MPDPLHDRLVPTSVEWRAFGSFIAYLRCVGGSGALEYRGEVVQVPASEAIREAVSVRSTVAKRVSWPQSETVSSMFFPMDG